MFDAKSAFETVKRYSVTFSLLTLIMLVVAEFIEIVVELGFTALQHDLVLWSEVSSPNHTVSYSFSSSVSVST